MLFKRLSLVGVLGIAVVGADVLSKRLAEVALSHGVEVALTPFLNLRLGFNPGISFGLFPIGSASGVAILIAVQGVIIAGMVVAAMWSRLLLERAAFGLIIGGAVGNVIDRARDGLVTDFLDLHLQGWHWPTFNIADMAICFGVAMLLWTSVSARRVSDDKLYPK
jgi:signal peptidase II